MTDNKKLKHVCPDCKVNKWIVDYREGCAANLTRQSVCLFCQQAKEIEKLKKENTELKNKIEDIYSQIKELNNEVVENGRGIHHIRDQLVAAKSTNTVRTKDKEERENYPRNKEEQFRKATGRRVTASKSKKQPENEIVTCNRFSLLANEEEETVLIGDSMVKNQGEHFGLQNTRKRKVRSYPGASARKIDEEIRKLNIAKKKTTIIVQASGNDLFLKNGNSGRTEPLVETLKRTIDTAKNKTKNTLVIGILPRLNVSHFSLSKALGINERLKAICQMEEVTFIDLWDTFYGNRKLFKRDGIHFSEEGMREYGNQLSLNLHDHLSKVEIEQVRIPENSSSTKQRDMIDNLIREQRDACQGN